MNGVKLLLMRKVGRRRSLILLRNILMNGKRPLILKRCRSFTSFIFSLKVRRSRYILRKYIRNSLVFILMSLVTKIICTMMFNYWTLPRRLLLLKAFILLLLKVTFILGNTFIIKRRHQRVLLIRPVFRVLCLIPGRRRIRQRTRRLLLSVVLLHTKRPQVPLIFLLALVIGRLVRKGTMIKFLISLWMAMVAQHVRLKRRKVRVLSLRNVPS